MNVLVIAPHPDDESIGCGGTVRLHAERGDRVVCVFLTSGELGLKHLPPGEAIAVREREADSAAAVLGLARLEFLRLADWFVGDAIGSAAAALCPLLRREVPATVYLPHPGEGHPDHRAALPVMREALRRTAGAVPPPRLLGYEVWTPLSAHDHVEDVTRVMPHKLRAIRCHTSQLAAFRYDRAVRGLNQYRGVMAARTRFAEVFVSLAAAESEASAAAGGGHDG